MTEGRPREDEALEFSAPLRWTFYDRGAIDYARARVPEDVWASSPAAHSQELAFAECADPDGERWTFILDGRVFRAAVSEFPSVVSPGRHPFTKNWWVERFSPEQILMRLKGWPEDWPLDDSAAD